MNRMKPRVFLSHDKADKPRVRIVKAILESKDIECWFDEERLLVGDSLFAGIQQGLAEADFVVVFFSRASLKSSWVELEAAASLITQLRGQSPRILPVKLDDLEPPPLLRDLLWADLSDEESLEGANQLAHSIISRFREPLEPALDSADAKELPSEMRALGEVEANPKFHWFIVSGASSAGKDVLTYVLDQRLSLRYQLDIATKYTTRERRASEPSNIFSLSEEEFEQKESSGDILFAYVKRHCRYGFDTKQFRRAIRIGYPLVSVFTHWELVPRITKYMNMRGLPVTTIFVNVPRSHLLRRVLFRNLPAEEIAGRVRSIEDDLRQITRRLNFKTEYTFLDNGDDRAFEESSKELTELVRSKIQRR